MASNIDTRKLAQVVADSYNVDELEVFLSDYFKIRLDHIVDPGGLSIPKIVHKVISYFDRRGNLTDLVRELGRDRAETINLLDLLVPPSMTSSNSSPSESSTSSMTKVDIDPDEVDFYFVIEPDRRSVSSPSKHKSANHAIYVRIPIVSRSLSAISASRQALALTFDRSGSMQGPKTDVARAAADYLLDSAQKPDHQVAVLAFDESIEIPVPLQQIKNSVIYKRSLRNIAPRGNTDLFGAWQAAVNELHVLDNAWDRRVVLITDGLMNRGMTDPAIFEQQVAVVWRTEKIATTCISMGSDWNVDLLSKLASVGGGSLHFIDTVNQAEQALHEAFHSSSGVVAYNLRMELEPLNSAYISQVNGVAASLRTGHIATFPMASQLLTNVEEQFILRLEFPSLASDKAIDVLRCALIYETPTSAQTLKTANKILHIFEEAPDSSSGPAIVHQGVICTAYATLSRELFKQALNAYLHQDPEMGTALLEQARFALQSTPTTPKGYLSNVNLQDRRIRDLESFQGQVPLEYIKQKYIEELSHRDVIWDRLCQLFDRLLASSNDVRFARELTEQFKWANRMIYEYAQLLPIPFDNSDTAFSGQLRKQDNLSRRERDLSTEAFWLSLMANQISKKLEEQRAPTRQQGEHQADLSYVIAILAGACFGLERTHQGTREDIQELMESYLESKYGIRFSSG